MFLADHSRREHARIQVREGYDPQTSKTRGIAHYLRGGQQVWSGMVISLSTTGSDVANRPEYVVGVPADAIQPLVYFALTDYFDSSVEATRKIPGLSCRENYVIETAWYDDQADYDIEGTPLTWDGATGKVTATTWDDDEDNIIGVTCADQEALENPIDRTKEYSEAEPPVTYLRFRTSAHPNRNTPPS